MSNTIINWRFWAYHLQVLRLSDWRWENRSRIIRWDRNAYHAKGGPGRKDGFWSPVELYEGKRYAVGLVLIIAAMIGSAVA